MSLSYARASRIASSCPKDFDFQFFVYSTEGDYPMWMSPRRIVNAVYALPESVVWNSIVAVVLMMCILMHSTDFESESNLFNLPVSVVIDYVFNSLYLLDIVAHILVDGHNVKKGRFGRKWNNIFWYVFDLLSFVHYQTEHLAPPEVHHYIKMACYYERLHRPFSFLFGLMDHHLIGNVLLSLLKFSYIFVVLRVIFANGKVWFNIIDMDESFFPDAPHWLLKHRARVFYRAAYIIDKLFVALGPDYHLEDDFTRLLDVTIMISGCLVVTGITIASLALIIGIYMRPEETFRSRFRLIMDDMKANNVPQELCDKVNTFYRMYWLKQKAVSKTALLPRFPPALVSAIRTDIYFEAQQKSQILRDMSFQFLSELAKYMETINYIPGDTIVARGTAKSAMIYISYGDVEMLTAEDDDTPVLRFTRGSIINPCGGCVQVACARAHVSIRAATFCTAHVLRTSDLWRVTMKYGKINGQAFILRSSFEEHFDKVRDNYSRRPHPPVPYKSNIMTLKHNLMELKNATGPDGRFLLARSDVFLEIAGCYIMRNTKDQGLAEESDEICLNPTFPCILQSSSSLTIAWDTFVALLTLVVAFLYPYHMVFIGHVSQSFRFFDLIVTLVYVVDIMSHLSTGATIEEGVPVTFIHTAARQIKSGWFVVDVISVVPIFEMVGEGYFAGINKIFKLLKVFRVLKRYEDMFVYQAKVLRFCSYCLLILLLVYLVGAINQGYKCTAHNLCELKNLTQSPFWGDLKADSENIELRILFNLYWSISVITFTSHKTYEAAKKSWGMQAFMLFILELCTKLHVIVEATYTATIMVTETMRVDYETCINTVKEFLIKNNIDPILRHRFVTYLELCWFTDKAYSINHEKTSILFDLPQHVYQDILAMQRSKYILCIPFMKFLNKEMLKNISSNARLFYTSPNEILLNTGDVSNEIYVIKQGFCEVYNPDTREVKSLISVRSYFGSLECLLRIPAFYTVRAVTHVEVFSISRRILLRAVRVPKIKDAIFHAKAQPEYSRLMKRRDQFLTYQMLPPPPDREFFPLPRKHEPDTAFLFPFNRLGFLAILRYVFPRYSIRPDSKYLTRYEWFRSLCAFLSANLFPLYSTLVLQWNFLGHFMLFLDLCAYFDILQRMLIGYFDKNGILVYHPASTAAHYMKGPFFIDLLGCLPLEKLDSIRRKIYVSSKGTRYPTSLQYFMYNRILQLYRLPNALEILHDYIDRGDIIFIIKTVPLFMAVLVVLTSMEIESTVFKHTTHNGGYELEIKRQNKYGNWIDNDGHFVGYNITETSYNLVLTIYYWSVYELTTTGFNIFQVDSLVHLYCIFFGMLIGATMTTYFSVRVISIRANVNQALASFQQNMRDMAQYMKIEKIDKELQEEVVSYYEYMWEKTGGTDYRAVLKLCDQITLRTDAILHIYGPTFSKCPILYHCEQSLLRVVGRAVYSTYYRGGMVVVDRDEILSCMYFIDHGTMEVRASDDDTRLLTKLPRGSIFGNLDNIPTVKCSNRFVVNSSVHLLQINSVMFYKIIQDFPTVRLLMKKYRLDDQSYVIGSSQDKPLTVWKERSMSSSMIINTRKGLLKYFYSHNKTVQIYSIIASLLCVYADIYNAGFLYNTKGFIICLYLLDFAFLIKIVLNIALPLINEDEGESQIVLMTERKQYFKGEFRYDIFSCLPLEVLCYTAENKMTAFAFLRLNRIFRLVTVHKCLNRYHKKLFINLSVVTVATVCIWFFMFVHCATCIWNLIGFMEELNKPKSSWRYRPDGHSWCNNEYICSVYFILTTFTQNGVGDILPRQQSEVLFTTILMMLSNMIYMVYVGEFSNIIQYQSFRCFNFFSKYLQLQAFLNNNRVAKNLVEFAKKYTLHLWRESRGLQAPRFLLSAPHCLKLRVMSAAYMHHLLAHPDFKDCEPTFLRHLVASFEHFYYNDNMYVVREGEITNSMYFIHQGSVDEIAEDIEEKMANFTAGEHFGSAQGLRRDTPFSVSYKTAVNSQVLALTLDKWEDLLQHFPKSKEIIYMEKHEGTRHGTKFEKTKKGKKKKNVQQSGKLEFREVGARTSETPTSTRFQEDNYAQTGWPTTATTSTSPQDKSFGEPNLPKSALSRPYTPFMGIPSGRTSDPQLTTSPVEPPAASESNEEEEYVPPPPTHGRRKSTIFDVDKAAVNEELNRLASSESIATEKSEETPKKE